jgi:hypothetical protein
MAADKVGVLARGERAIGGARRSRAKGAEARRCIQLFERRFAEYLP